MRHLRNRRCHSAKCRRPIRGTAVHCEPLESRRLLTFTVNGTAAGDLIEMSVGLGLITVTVNGLPSIALDLTESTVVINGLGGNDTIKINSTGDNSVAVSGGADDDTVTLAEDSGVISAIAAPVSADGGAGYNVIRFYDWSNDSVANIHSLNATTYDSATSAPVTYANFTDLRILCGEKNDTVNIDNTANWSYNYIRPNLGVDSIHVNRTGPGSYVAIDPSNNASLQDSLSVGNGTGSALVRQYASISMGAISVGSGGLPSANEGGTTTITCKSLSVASDSSLDLTDNALIIDYSGAADPFLTLRSYVAAGYNGGLWTGNGIRSSIAAGTTDEAIGIIESNNIFSTYPQTFAGVQVAHPSVLIRETHYGDTDLNGNVNLLDFNRLAARFNGGSQRWFDGDSDFNQIVNLPDFNRLGGNFNGSGLPSAPVEIGVNVMDFGAVPDDGIDDTAAINAAINSLPLSDGAPSGQAPAGGIVLFPAGTFNISSTIRLHSGVKLEGVGPTTVISDVWNTTSHVALELFSPFVHHFNIGASIENLTIDSLYGGGVRVDPNMGGDLIDFRMNNVRVSARSWNRSARRLYRPQRPGQRRDLQSRQHRVVPWG